MEPIPLIHLADFRSGTPAIRRQVVDAVRQSCIDIGFLYVGGHGIAPQIFTAMRRAVVAIFNQPEHVKVAHSVSRDNYRGYIPLGFFTPASGACAPDRYEGYKLHLDVPCDDPLCGACDLYGPNLWPQDLTAQQAAVAAYWRALDDLAGQLLRVFGLALGKPEAFFLPWFDQPLTNMTLLHYPPMPPKAAGFGIHPHKDSSAFTILYPDPIGGLLVQTRDGDWIEAHAPEGAFVVNIGDVLEHWTGGTFRSTPHQVINRTGQERYSFPYFVTPRFDTMVAPVVPPVAGYDRPEIRMEDWQRAIFDSNWPDAAAIEPDLDPVMHPQI